MGENQKGKNMVKRFVGMKMLAPSSFRFSIRLPFRKYSIVICMRILYECVFAIPISSVASTPFVFFFVLHNSGQHMAGGNNTVNIKIIPSTVFVSFPHPALPAHWLTNTNRPG